MAFFLYYQPHILDILIYSDGELVDGIVELSLINHIQQAKSTQIILLEMILLMDLQEHLLMQIGVYTIIFRTEDFNLAHGGVYRMKSAII